MTNQCELCTSTEELTPLDLGAKATVSICSKCFSAISENNYNDTSHWRCLHEAIWSESTAVKVLSYRILHGLRNESWAIELRDQIYLEDEDLTWAKLGIPEDSSNNSEQVTKDSNGVPLLEGDSVTLIKDLDVKGAGFTAKRGTLVKNIRLTENPEHIEGKVNGTTIVLVAKFMKKATA